MLSKTFHWVLLSALVCAQAVIITTRAGAAMLQGRACYQLGEQDTIAKAKEQARLEALRNLVSNYKTYVFSNTETKNLILQNDQLQAIAGGPLRKLECSFPPIAEYRVCAECVADVVEDEMNRFLEERLRILGISAGQVDPKIVVSKKTGSLAIRTNATGSIAVNGNTMESITPSDEVKIDNLPIGKHKVTLNLQGRTLSKEVFISEKEVTPLYFRDPVAAISQGKEGEILDPNTLVQALSYLNNNYGQIDRINELLSERVVGKRFLVRGFVISFGTPGATFEKTRWYPPGSDGVEFESKMPLVVNVPAGELNSVGIPFVLAISDKKFSYSRVFTDSFARDFPALYLKYIKGLESSKYQEIYLPPINTPLGDGVNFSRLNDWFGYRGTSSVKVDPMDHFRDPRSADVPIVTIVGTIKQLEVCRVERGNIYLGFFILTDSSIVSINNADIDTLLAEIFEQEKSKERGLDEIFKKEGSANVQH